MEEKILRAYLRLCLDSEFALHSFAALLQQYGCLSAISTALQNRRDNDEQCDSLRVCFANAQSGEIHNCDESVEQALRWEQQEGNKLIPFESCSYPYLLKQIPRPPPLLFAVGDSTLLDSACCAVVGSRACSSYGERHARWFAHELSRLNITIVSGLARGIDHAAHRGALQAGGKTIAVLGTGIDRVYPAVNKPLFEQISKAGLLISEFTLAAPPRAEHFPRRNRIIAGLSLGTLVVEGSLRSGSLITARLAMEQGRLVFALPGPVDNRKSQGCHKLLREGASLVESPHELCEQLLADWHHCPVGLTSGNENRSRLDSSTVVPLSGNEQNIIAALTEPDMLIDRLLGVTGLPASEFNAALVKLESLGLVAQQGGRVSRA